MIRYTPEEKMEIIHLVEHSELPVKQTLERLQVPRSTFSRRTPGRCMIGTDVIRSSALMG